MATSKRDVRLGVEIETTGQEGIRQLAEEVRRLAREGGDAAPEFQALATQLDRLSGQAGAIDSLKRLNAEIDVLAANEREAAAEAKRVGDAFVEQRAKSELLRDNQQRVASALGSTKIALTQAAVELANFTRGATASTKASAAYQPRLEELGSALGNLKIRQAELTAERTKAAAELRAAERAENQLATQTERASAAAKSAAAALRERTSALDRAQAAALAAGVDTERLAAAEADVVAAVQNSVAVTNRLAAERAEAAQAAAEGAEAVRKLEQASKDADKEVEQLAASLRGAEQAVERYAAATEQAAAAGGKDERANRERRAAAEALIEAERRLTVGQRELAVARDATRGATLAEAQALLQAARAADQSQAATARVVREARQAEKAIEDAFAKTGVRSLNAIETEIRETERAMSLLERRVRSGAISQEDFGRASAGAAARIRTLKAEIASVPTEATVFQRLSAGADDLVTKYGRLTAVAATLGFAVKPLVDATIALDQARRVLTTISGSAEEAERQLNFLRKTAQESGQAFDDISASYAKFAASATQSGLSFRQVQEVFRSVSLAAGNLGLSSDQTTRALEALSQIASKGVVSMEELRQQLGDALPGVLPLLARELGVTQAELNKVVESGQLLAVEAIPAIGRSLKALGPASGGIDSIVASFNRFVNVLKQAGTTLVEGPIGQIAGTVLTALAGVLRDISYVAVLASEGLKQIGFSIVAVLDAMRPTGPTFAEAGDAISKFVADSGQRLDTFREAAYGVRDASKETAAEMSGLGASFARLAIDQQKAVEKGVLAAQSAEKLVAAKKKEAEALQVNAGLIGTETAAREASLEGARLVLQATEAQARADEELVATIERSIDAEKRDAQARYGSIEPIKLAIEALEKRIQKARDDAEVSKAAAQAARANADAMALAAEKALDNSARLSELRGELESATTRYVALSRRFAEGRATTEELETASRNLTKAKALLADAIEDVDDALKAQIETIKADAELAKAQIQLEITKLKLKEDELRLNGRKAAADAVALNIQRLELNQTTAGNNAKREEAVAIIRATSVKLDELRASNQLTPQIELELQTRIKQQQAVLVSTQATSLQTEAQEKNLKATQGSTTGLKDHAEAQRGSKGATEGATEALRKQAEEFTKVAEASTLWSKEVVANYNKVKEAIDKAYEAQRKLDASGPGANGGLGEITSAGLGPGTATSVLNKEERVVGGQYTPPDNSGDWYFDTAAWQAAGGVSAGFSNEAAKIFWRRTSIANRAAANTSRSAFGGVAGSPQQRAGATYNTTINVGGRQFQVGVRSQADVDLLIQAIEAARLAGDGG